MDGSPFGLSWPLHQLLFEDATLYTCKKEARKQRLLSAMDRVIPWKDRVDTVEPHYPKGTVPSPIPLDTMLRLYFMPQGFGYSDPAMEEAR